MESKRGECERVDVDVGGICGDRWLDKDNPWEHGQSILLAPFVSVVGREDIFKKAPLKLLAAFSGTLCHLQVGRWIVSWMDGWMDGWEGGMDGWMDVWMDGWMDGTGEEGEKERGAAEIER